MLKWSFLRLVCCFLMLGLGLISGAHSKAKNVILFIGDGMGLSHLTAARIKSAGTQGRLHIESMPVVGLLRTHSADNLVTDSAAAATALATGFKTNNGKVAMSPEGRPLLTFFEVAKDKGLSTGVVATSSLTHATPACFIAHVGSRKEETKIAEQIPGSKIDLILAGGRGFLMPQSVPGSLRTDDRDLLAEAQQSGYSLIQTTQELAAAKSIPLLGLFQTGHLTTQDPEPSLQQMTSKSIHLVMGLFQTGRLTTHDPEPSLQQMTAKAIELLSRNSKGFVLMVEGSQIDWGSHANLQDESIRQTLLLDHAVESALKFARDDKKTLVLVTADHETGGMAIRGGSLDGTTLDIAWTTKKHTGVVVPIYALGPGARHFGGHYDNTEVPRKIMKQLGIPDFPRPH